MPICEDCIHDNKCKDCFLKKGIKTEIKYWLKFFSFLGMLFGIPVMCAFIVVDIFKLTFTDFAFWFLIFLSLEVLYLSFSGIGIEEVKKND